MVLSDTVMLSPALMFDWNGFRASSANLMCSGWEVVCRYDEPKYYEFILNNPESGLSGYGYGYSEEINGAALRYSKMSRSDKAEMPIIRITHMTTNRSLYVDVYNMKPITLTTKVEEISYDRINECLAETGFFRPRDKSIDLIVEPETVEKLFEKIKQLQAPELAAIRQRNRLKEKYQERTIAQIISIESRG